MSRAKRAPAIVTVASLLDPSIPARPACGSMAIVEAADGFYLCEARDSKAVPEKRLAGPYATREEADRVRTEVYRPKAKRRREGRAPLVHASPAIARSRVGGGS